MTTETLTFDDLCKLEPRLRALETATRVAARIENRKRLYRCGNRVFYRDIKPQLVWYVGFQRRDEHPILSTSEAYDVVYDHLYKMMPDCRVCSCMSL